MSREKKRCMQQVSTRISDSPQCRRCRRAQCEASLRVTRNPFHRSAQKVLHESFASSGIWRQIVLPAVLFCIVRGVICNHSHVVLQDVPNCNPWATSGGHARFTSEEIHFYENLLGISAGLPTVVTEVVGDFPQFLRANTRIYTFKHVTSISLQIPVYYLRIQPTPYEFFRGLEESFCSKANKNTAINSWSDWWPVTVLRDLAVSTTLN